jgi:hypothetical protein
MYNVFLEHGAAPGAADGGPVAAEAPDDPEGEESHAQHH